MRLTTPGKNGLECWLAPCATDTLVACDHANEPCVGQCYAKCTLSLPAIIFCVGGESLVLSVSNLNWDRVLNRLITLESHMLGFWRVLC
jgi:hypothetical protein